MGKRPDRREFRRADDAENLRRDPVRYLLRCGRQRPAARLSTTMISVRGIHQPHADGVAAEPEERHVPERQDAAIAPDKVHRERDEAQAQRLAQRLDEAGRDHADPEAFGARIVTPMVKSARHDQEDQHRRVAHEGQRAAIAQGGRHVGMSRLMQASAARPLSAMMPAAGTG
jgi:hypothetical protein